MPALAMNATRGFGRSCPSRHCRRCRGPSGQRAASSQQKLPCRVVLSSRVGVPGTAGGASPGGRPWLLALGGVAPERALNLVWG